MPVGGITKRNTTEGGPMRLKVAGLEVGDADGGGIVGKTCSVEST